MSLCHGPGGSTELRSDYEAALLLHSLCWGQEQCYPTSLQPPSHHPCQSHHPQGIHCLGESSDGLWLPHRLPGSTEALSSMGKGERSVSDTSSWQQHEDVCHPPAPADKESGIFKAGGESSGCGDIESGCGEVAEPWRMWALGTHLGSRHQSIS